MREAISAEVAAAVLQQSSEIAVFFEGRETLNGDAVNDFAQIQSGQNLTVTVQVQNLGGAALSVELPEIWPVEDSPFSISSHPENRILAQNESLKFTLDFEAPTEAGDYTASLYIYSNDEDENSYKLDMNWSSHEVVYKLNNDESDIIMAALPNSKLLEPFPPKKLGYLFEGWYKDANFNNQWDFSADMVSSDISLYAHWIYNPGVPVYYKANGAEGEPPASQWKVTGEYLVLALGQGSLSKTGHSFAGWNTNAEGTGLDYESGATYSVEQELILYAQWSPRTYTISFNTSPGSHVDSQTLLYGERVAIPEDPILSDWSFAGWYEDSAFNYPWDFVLDTVEDDTVIYARWSNEAFTVTFDSNGGTPVEEQTVIYGDNVAEPIRPARLNHSFSGWYTAGSGGELWDFSDPVTGGDMTLYAQWELIEAGTVKKYTDGIYSFNMIQVPGIDIMPLGSEDELSMDSVDPYEISETEVTYLLWAVVCNWAESNGFSGLDGSGTMGDGTDDTLDHPVMDMTIYRAMLWCNALTAWYNDKTNSDFELCYVDSGGEVITDYVSGGGTFYLKTGADGFRLPTNAEWELAARWRNDDTNTVIWASDPWFTKGDSVSGGLEALGSSSTYENFAWTYNAVDPTAKPVAQLLPNALGIFDMCGNGFEWIFRVNGATTWLMKGGSYMSGGGDSGKFSYAFLKIGETFSILGTDTSAKPAIRLVRSIF